LDGQLATHYHGRHGFGKRSRNKRKSRNKSRSRYTAALGEENKGSSSLCFCDLDSACFYEILPALFKDSDNVALLFMMPF
jgi:hypothetical protein